MVTCIAIALLAGSAQSAFRRDFSVDVKTLAAQGRGAYWVLEPGYQLVLDGKEDGVAVHLVITVLDQTKLVDGVKTRVVEERESKGGKLIEVSRNYMAFDPKSKDVYYFGEDVDMVKDGKVVSHEGAWLSGVKGARFGLLMPGTPKLKDRYYQEIAEGVAMDRAETVSLSETVSTPAGRFEKCLKMEETTPLEPGAKEYKLYAPGVGLIVDGPLKLTKRGMAAAKG